MPETTRAEQMFGDFAPKLVSLTTDVLFADIWEPTELSPRDRSFSPWPRSSPPGARAATRPSRQSPSQRADPAHLKEVITHLAFYAGWPNAMSAMAVAKRELEN
jgi:4-carboxymuconolactone decarboxylase